MNFDTVEDYGFEQFKGMQSVINILGNLNLYILRAKQIIMQNMVVLIRYFNSIV